MLNFFRIHLKHKNKAQDFKKLTVSAYPSGARLKVIHCALAALIVIAAAYCTFVVPGLHKKAIFLPAYLAIMLSAHWLGRLAGLSALFLALALINGLYLIPDGDLGVQETFILNAVFSVAAFSFIHTVNANRELHQRLFSTHQELIHAQISGNTGSWRLNIGNKELIWSPQTYRIFGLPDHLKITYDVFLDCAHPDDRAIVETKWLSALQGEPYDIEHRIIANGCERWVRERAYLELGAGGELLGGFGTVQDITDLKAMEQALMESWRRHEQMLQIMTDAIITAGEDGRILTFNEAAQKMFGCSDADAAGSHLGRFLPHHAQTSIFTHLEDFFRNGSSEHMVKESRFMTGLRASGEEFPIEASLSGSLIAGEKRVILLLHDLSPSREAQLIHAERLQLQDQIVKIAASVPGVIGSFRLSVDGKVSMPYASPAIERVYGLTAEAVAEDAALIFTRIHPEDLTQVQESTNESARTLQPWRQVFRYHHPQKGERWLEGHSLPVREADGGCLWHGYMQDVTERMAAEISVLNRERLLQLIMDSMPALISYLDTDFRYIKINKAYEKWFKLSPGEIIGRTVQEIIGAESWTFIQPYLQKAGGGEAVKIDFQFKLAAARPRWVEASYIPDKDANQQVRGIVVQVVDIEERIQSDLRIKLLNEQLQHRLDEMKAIFEAAPAGLAITHDPEARHISGNPALEQMLAVPAGSELSKTADNTANYCVMIEGRCIPDSDLPMQRAARGELIKNQLLTILRTDGQVVSLLVNARPLTTRHGALRGSVGVFLDMSRQAKVERHLQQSQQQLRLLIEQAPLSIAMFDTQMNYLAASRFWTKSLGGGRESLTGLNHYDIVPDIPAEWKERHRRVLAGECLREERELWLRSDGSKIWVRWAAQPWTDAEGLTGGIIITGEDVTLQHQAEEAARASEQFTRDVLNSLPEQIAVLDKDGKIIAVNDAWEQFACTCTSSARSAELTLGENYLESCRRAAASGDIFGHQALLGLQALQAGGQQDFAMEYPCLTPNGELWFLMNAKLMNNNPGGVIISHLNITALKLTQEALRESKMQLALIVAELNAASWDYDIKRDVLYVSPEWKRQLGIAEQESVNHWELWESRLHPSDQAFVIESIRNYIAGRQLKYELEYRIRHASGHYLWLHSRGALLYDPGGKPHRLLGMNLDVTDFKTSKQLTEQRGQMEQSFRLYVASQTAAAIAHELNQPLTAIAYFSDVARNMVESGRLDNKALSNLLERCEQQAQRAGEVMRRLIGLLHQGETVAEPVDISQAISEACQIIKVEGMNKSFDLVLNLAPDLPPVQGSRLLIQKVLINLVVNSVQAMQEYGLQKGAVTISSKICEDEANMAQVSVQDEARNMIEEASLKKIFQPFYSTKKEGLGMGLAISRSLIEAHGGNLNAKRNEGGGLSIHFTLPFVS